MPAEACKLTNWLSLDHVVSASLRAEDLNSKNGWEVPILVDAAIGGFVAPFLYPDLAWDFRLKNVHSIAVSGHKCALSHACLLHAPAVDEMGWQHRRRAGLCEIASVCRDVSWAACNCCWQSRRHCVASEGSHRVLFSCCCSAGRQWCLHAMRAQVWAGLPGRRLARLPRQGLPAGGHGAHDQLPGPARAHHHDELLPERRPGCRLLLQRAPPPPSPPPLLCTARTRRPGPLAALLAAPLAVLDQEHCLRLLSSSCCGLA